LHWRFFGQLRTRYHQRGISSFQAFRASGVLCCERPITNGRPGDFTARDAGNPIAANAVVNDGIVVAHNVIVHDGGFSVKS
jgi:hypothetical protein